MVYGPPQGDVASAGAGGARARRTPLDDSLATERATGQRQLANQRRAPVALALVPSPGGRPVQPSQTSGAGAHGFERVEHRLCDRVVCDASSGMIPRPDRAIAGGS